MSGNSSQMSAAVNETSYLIRGLTPCTEYTIFVSAVSTSSPSVQSDKTRATSKKRSAMCSCMLFYQRRYKIYGT